MLKFHPLRVAQVQMQAEDAVALALELPAELAAEYRGLPGQHIVLRASLDGVEVRRTYSLISAPGEPQLRIVARVHPEGRLSSHLAQRVRRGDRLEVLPPNGSFVPHSAAMGRGTCAAFAAGCGITPILSIARSWLEAGPTGRVVLFYGNRSMARTMCSEELLALKDRYLERLALHFVMSREPQELALYNGRLDGERVRHLARSFLAPADVAEYFLCGPGDMIPTASRELQALGVSPARIRAEHFSVANAGQEAAAGAAAAPAQVRNASAGSVELAEVTIIMDGRRRSFAMRMNGDSVLDGAAKAGLELPFSCRAGVCSTCRTKVVGGEVAMTQNYALEDWELEQGYVLACQSKVKTPVLELDYDER
jgi:ring-1,2-phenylacetyl-CoA epoxidase subunit PaaE